jgi:hypothetical protein
LSYLIAKHGGPAFRPEVTKRFTAVGESKRRKDVPRTHGKKIVLILGLALILAAGGIVTASNMGFKFVKSYTGPGTVANSVSLPYFQSQFTSAKSMFDDITGATRVCKVEANTTLSCWLGDFGGSAPFNIVSQNALVVNVAASTTQTIVGSHDPALAITLTGPGTVANFKSVPYHSTYTSLKGVFDDITGTTRVCKLQPNTTFSCWLGDFGGSAPDTVTLGEGLLINVAASTTWTPDHY